MLKDDFLKMSQEEYDKFIDSQDKMTPEEKLFSKFFFHETKFVMNMDTLTLRAHREELMQIAKEARARITAVDDVENHRKKQANPKGPTGFSHSVNSDETTTNAINVVKERQKRMTAAEKVQASLEKLGISTADAEKLMSAGTILSRIKGKGQKAEDILTGKIEVKTESPEPQAPVESAQQKPLFNPFAK